MSRPTAIVIGAGIGGLATAALLARDGYKVTVLEKNEQLGGRAWQLKEKGYTFDMGPSWYLMPEVFDRFFASFGKKTSQYLAVKRLSPQHRIFFADQTHVDITGNLAKDRATFDAIEAGSGQKLMEYLEASKEKYDTAINHFLYRNMDSIFDFFTPELLTRGRQLSVFESMANYVKKYFKSEKLQQIIQYTLVFLGGSPHNTPALYSLMSHIDFNLGVWYPKKGIYAIVEALVKLGKEYGVTYNVNSPVSQLIVEEKEGTPTITAVKVGRKTFTADVIVSNADYAHTEELLSEERYAQYGKNYWKRKTLAPSAFLLYLGVKGKIPQLVHHNLYFGENWISHFQEIFDKPSWPKTPSVYINKITHADPSLAPKGHEALFLLVPIASNLAENAQSRRKYADFVIKYLDAQMGLNLEKRISYQKIFSVSDFATRFNSLGGSALGLSHTLLQTAIWRPSNKSSKVQNLFFVGANTVPGIGMPICLISAELVRQRLQTRGR